jgi:hypothetical protein
LSEGKGQELGLMPGSKNELSPCPRLQRGINGLTIEMLAIQNQHIIFGL